MRALLEIHNLSQAFGGLQALDGLSFSLGEGESLALIGPNGSGKSTTLNCLSGHYRPQGGEIRFSGQSLLGKRPDQIARLGIARSFQQAQLFQGLSVRQHVQLARQIRADVPRTAASLEEDLQQCELLPFADLYPSELNFALQKRLGLAMCLASGAKLLLLDEPAAGLLPEEQHSLAQLIVRLRTQQPFSLLLVEHQPAVIEALADRVLVLHEGKILAEGSFEEMRRHPEVVRVYWGEKL